MSSCCLLERKHYNLKCANISQILSKDHTIKYCTLETPLKAYHEANDSKQDYHTEGKTRTSTTCKVFVFNLILLMTTEASDIL